MPGQKRPPEEGEEGHHVPLHQFHHGGRADPLPQHGGFGPALLEPPPALDPPTKSQSGHTIGGPQGPHHPYHHRHGDPGLQPQPPLTLTMALTTSSW